MRFRAYPFVVLAIVLLALPAVAAAGPKPILKPKDTKVTPAKPVTPAKAPPAATGTTGQAPIQKPGTPTKTPTTTKTTTTTKTKTKTKTKTPPSTTGAGTGTGAPTAPAVTSTPPPPPALVVVESVGRDQAGAQAYTAAVPAVASPDPTPLAVVAAGDRAGSHTTSTPAWKLALLALLAAAEAFLVVRLVRHRPGTLSPVS